MICGTPGWGICTIGFSCGVALRLKGDRDITPTQAASAHLLFILSPSK